MATAVLTFARITRATNGSSLPVILKSNASIFYSTISLMTSPSESLGCLRSQARASMLCITTVALLKYCFAVFLRMTRWSSIFVDLLAHRARCQAPRSPMGCTLLRAMPVHVSAVTMY